MSQDQSSLFKLIACVGCGSATDGHLQVLQTKVVHKGIFEGKSLNIVMCPQCGLVFLQPQPTPEALGWFYEHEYYTYLAAPSSDSRLMIEREKWKKDFLYFWVIDHIPAPVRKWNILDVGAGYGIWLQWFDKSNHLFALEPSQQAADVAARLFGIHVHQVDFLQNHLEGQQFDLLTGLAVIEHFPDPFAALVEMNRLLKKGGYLYLQTPDLHGSVFRQGTGWAFKVVHTFYFSLSTISELVQRAGFEIVAARRRPPLVETASIWYPHNSWAGELDILARKRHERTLEEARAQPYSSSEDLSSVLDNIKAARRRDWFYIWLAVLQEYDKGKILYQLSRLARKYTSPPPSIYAEQAIRLGLKIDQ